MHLQKEVLQFPMGFGHTARGGVGPLHLKYITEHFTSAHRSKQPLHKVQTHVYTQDVFINICIAIKLGGENGTLTFPLWRRTHVFVCAVICVRESIVWSSVNRRRFKRCCGSSVKPKGLTSWVSTKMYEKQSQKTFFCDISGF